MLKKELNIICSAFLFFTRIRFPFNVPYNRDNLGLVITYFPFIGLFIGAISGLSIKILLLLHLPKLIAIILVLLIILLLTGALHEDGFADVLDGFGGAYTKERILEIMQDSSIGTYGSLGLIFLLLFKISVIFYIPNVLLPVVFVATHALSRWGIVFITYFWQYARPTGKSKSRDMVKKLSIQRILIASITAILPLFFFSNPLVFILILIVPLISLLSGSYYAKRIGGYTGDCLGATQQILELFILFLFFTFSLFDV